MVLKSLVFPVALTLWLFVLAGGCGGPAASTLTSTPSSSAPAPAAAGAGASVVSAPAITQASAFAREYARLHGVTPVGTLSTVIASQAEIVADLRSGYTGDRLLLPSTLPPGYALAAPFRGTGSGTPLPNPHAWGSGYAVTYTDESGRITLVVHPDDPLAGGEWLPTDAAFGGRALVVQERGGLVLVSTRLVADAQVVVIGERLSRAEVLRVAGGLAESE
ncbi:MAG: hypothetical protein ACYC33_08330 [Thermoleophilia bacterium]